MSKHPMQKMELSTDGVIRFRKNLIVCHLLSASGEDFNTISIRHGFSQEDLAQFAALTGYSVAGWGSLSFVSGKQAKKAGKKAEKVYRRSLHAIQS